MLAHMSTEPWEAVEDGEFDEEFDPELEEPFEPFPRARRWRIVSLVVVLAMIVTGPAALVFFGSRHRPTVYSIAPGIRTLFPAGQLELGDRLRCGTGDELSVPERGPQGHLDLRPPGTGTDWQLDWGGDGALVVSCA